MIEQYFIINNEYIFAAKDRAYYIDFENQTIKHEQFTFEIYDIDISVVNLKKEYECNKDFIMVNEKDNKMLGLKKIGNSNFFRIEHNVINGYIKKEFEVLLENYNLSELKKLTINQLKSKKEDFKFLNNI